jgi:hypothetical protein
MSFLFFSQLILTLKDFFGYVFPLLFLLKKPSISMSIRVVAVLFWSQPVYSREIVIVSIYDIYLQEAWKYNMG